MKSETTGLEISWTKLAVRCVYPCNLKALKVYLCLFILVKEKKKKVERKGDLCPDGVFHTSNYFCKHQLEVAPPITLPVVQK